MITIKTNLSVPPLLHGRAAQSVDRPVLQTFKRWWAAYVASRNEQRVIAELLSMSDRDLRDFGINRREILRAVRGDTAREGISLYDAMPISSQYRGRMSEGNRCAASPVG